MIRKALFPLLAIALAVGVFLAMVATPPEIVAEPQARKLPAVDVTTVRPDTVRMKVRSQGSVKPRISSAIKSQVNGTIEWTAASLADGGSFKKGDKLLSIDPTDYKAEMANAEIAEIRAGTELSHARKEYRRMLSLEKQKLASDAQVDEAQRSLQLAEAQQREAKVRKASAAKALERTEVFAPYDGVVSKKQVDVGQFITRGELIADIYATDLYEVAVPVSIDKFLFLETAYLGSRFDQEKAPKAMLTATLGQEKLTWPGYLHRTDGQLDEATRLIHAVVRAPNQLARGIAPLLPGFFVEVEIDGLSFENVVTLPRSALRDGDRVLIVDKESRLRFRAVEVLRREGDNVYISKGLKAGEKVCLSPLLVVVDGMRVTARES